MKTEKQKNLEGTNRPDRVQGAALVDYLKELPKPAAIYKLDTQAKKWYKFLGATLIATGRLAQLDIPNLILLANSWAQYAWANQKINEKNKEEAGSGYMQTYKTGATNITTEYKIRGDAEEAILKVSKLFGMSFKDRHQLNGFFEEATGQLDLFEGMQSAHPDNNQSLKVVGGEQG